MTPPILDTLSPSPLRKETLPMKKVLKRGLPLAMAMAGALTLSACELPQPPVDGIQQAKDDAKKSQDEAARAAQLERQKATQAQVATEATAQQTGLVEGGPSAVTPAQRLQFLKSQDLTIQYTSLGFNILNKEVSEVVIPANSKVFSEGEKVPLASVPSRAQEGQLLPHADLNGATVTVLNQELRANALVLKILGAKQPVTNLKAEGTLVLKAPDVLQNLCEEGPNVDCTGRNLFGRDWTGKVFDGIIARKANATNLTATGASLLNCDFSGAQLYRSNFLGANITGCRFVGIKGQNLMMNSDRKTDATLTRAVGADFTGAYLYRCEFDYTDLTNSIWDKADAQNCTFDSATMTGLRASGAWFHRLKASNVTMVGAVAPNARFSQGTLVASNLSKSILSGAKLDRIEGRRMNLSDAILTGKGCTMAQSYLDLANLSRLQATGCTFPRASMKGALARDIQAANADFTYTDLKGADFTKGNLMGANFFNADTKGLNTAGANLMGATCPNGDVVGKTAYGRYGNQTVTGCVWNDKNFSISKSRIFKSSSRQVGTLTKTMQAFSNIGGASGGAAGVEESAQG